MTDDACLSCHDVLAWSSRSRDDNRKTAGLRFEDHVPCGVGATRKHEQIGRSEDLRDRVARQWSGEDRIGHAPLQFREQRAAASDDEAMLDAECVQTIL